ncbi:hypothetical protein AWN90_30565 [Nocardia terpenica]|uniref:Uncharacterized protein n=1 Tax=Nocardia terpenica TaxID=455432 RepID=A0A164M5V6_9NOCA|nr:hypothetical protein AWN90_30565 [Nocardia terpenica]
MVRIGALELGRQLRERGAVTRGRFMERCGEAETLGAREGEHRVLELVAVTIGQVVTHVSIDQRFHPNLRMDVDWDSLFSWLDRPPAEAGEVLQFRRCAGGLHRAGKLPTLIMRCVQMYLQMSMR